jgi:hypothetical protein
MLWDDRRLDYDVVAFDGFEGVGVDGLLALILMLCDATI